MTVFACQETCSKHHYKLAGVLLQIEACIAEFPSIMQLAACKIIKKQNFKHNSMSIVSSPAHARCPAPLAERFAAHWQLYSLHLPCLLLLPFAEQGSLPTLQVTLALTQRLPQLTEGLYLLVQQALQGTQTSRIGPNTVKEV